MLTIRVFNDADYYFERALQSYKGRFPKGELSAAKACLYRRALYSDKFSWPHMLVLCPDASELSDRDQGALRVAEHAAAQGLIKNGVVVLAFGDPAAGRACCSRILRLAGRPARHAGETP